MTVQAKARLRLLPHRVLECYEAANVEPMTNGYLRFEPDINRWCACPLTALYLYAHPDKSVEQAFKLDSMYWEDDLVFADTVKPWLKTHGFDAPYLLGYQDGFDDGSYENFVRESTDNPVYEQGYEDGRLAYVAIKDSKGGFV